MKTFYDFYEEAMAAPTNSVGGGQIAGTVEAGDDPPKKKKQKNYPKHYVQMYRDMQKGNRLKSVMT